MNDSGGDVPDAIVGGNVRGRRQIIVLLCAACAFISIADRSSLSVLIIDMKEELHWSAGKEATVMSSFYYGIWRISLIYKWCTLLVHARR